jgi:hypothetical protein
MPLLGVSDLSSLSPHTGTLALGRPPTGLPVHSMVVECSQMEALTAKN